MAIIQIDEKNRIASDKYQWMAQKYRGVDKHGKPIWESYLYFSDLGQLVGELVQREVRTSDAEGLAEVLRVHESACHRLSNALKPIVTISPRRLEDARSD